MINRVKEAKSLAKGGKCNLDQSQFETLWAAFLDELPKCGDTTAIKEISLMDQNEKMWLIELLSNKYISKL